MKQNRDLYLGLIFGTAFGLGFGALASIFVGTMLDSTLLASAVGALSGVAAWFVMATLQRRRKRS